MASSMSSHTQTYTQILSERSPNTSSSSVGGLSPSKKGGNNIMEGNGFGENGGDCPRFQNTKSQHQQSYISPSDALQSPTTKKLSDLKAKKINGGKGKTLFQGIVGRRDVNATSAGKDAFGDK